MDHHGDPKFWHVYTKGIRPWLFGHLHMTTIRLWFLRIHEFSLVEIVTGFALDLHESSFGPPHSIFQWMTWNPTWQVWFILAKIVGIVFGTSLDSRHDIICDGF